MAQKPSAIKLENRGLVRVGGPDCRAFLQDLVTNDVNLVTAERLVYACFLTPQGKFLHDFFMLEQDGDIVLDCEGGARAEDLARRLSAYRLRKNVEITTMPEHDVYAVFGTKIGWADPRHPEMGHRTFEKPDLPIEPFAAWDRQRIERGIPDGSRDLIPEKSTLDEGRIDQLGGVSYDKGCYIGQELTARMHYRGLGKKHLEMVDVNALPAGAELRSSCGDIGLALVKAV